MVPWRYTDVVNQHSTCSLYLLPSSMNHILLSPTRTAQKAKHSNHHSLMLDEPRFGVTIGSITRDCALPYGALCSLFRHPHCVRFRGRDPPYIPICRLTSCSHRKFCWTRSQNVKRQCVGLYVSQTFTQRCCVMLSTQHRLNGL